MKNSLFAVSITLMGLFISCNKCKDVECLNGGTCNKGDCECTFLYTGDKCDNEVRNQYVGRYAGTADFGGGDTQLDTLVIRTMGTDASKLEVLDSDGIVLTLTSASAFTFLAEEVDGTEVYRTSGNGTFTSTAVSLSGTGTYSDMGQVLETETFKFDGTKL